jgi:hypothetical protein
MLQIMGESCYIDRVMFVIFVIALRFHEMFPNNLGFTEKCSKSSQLNLRDAFICACNRCTTDANIFMKFKDEKLVPEIYCIFRIYKAASVV